MKIWFLPIQMQLPVILWSRHFQEPWISRDSEILPVNYAFLFLFGSLIFKRIFWFWRICSHRGNQLKYSSFLLMAIVPLPMKDFLMLAIDSSWEKDSMRQDFTAHTKQRVLDPPTSIYKSRQEGAFRAVGIGCYFYCSNQLCLVCGTRIYA